MEKRVQKFKIRYHTTCKNCKLNYNAKHDDSLLRITLSNRKDVNFDEIHSIDNIEPYFADMFNVKFKLNFECFSCGKPVKRDVEIENNLVKERSN